MRKDPAGSPSRFGRIFMISGVHRLLSIPGKPEWHSLQEATSKNGNRQRI